jgi:hypothetical protein
MISRVLPSASTTLILWTVSVSKLADPRADGALVSAEADGE